MLDTINRAAKQQRNKDIKAHATIDHIDVTQWEHSNSRESSPSFPLLFQVDGDGDGDSIATTYWMMGLWLSECIFILVVNRHQ